MNLSDIMLKQGYLRKNEEEKTADLDVSLVDKDDSNMLQPGTSLDEILKDYAADK